YTVFLASRLKTVDAFEPALNVLPMLRSNLELNGITNVHIHQLCVGQSAGPLNFRAAMGSNTGVGYVTLESDGAIQLPCTSIDEFLKGSADEALLIKMDIEGAEWLAVQGARTLNQRQSPV